MSVMLHDVWQKDVVRFAESTFRAVSVPASVVKGELVNGLRVHFIGIEVDVLVDVNHSVHGNWRRASVWEHQNLAGETPTWSSIQSLAFCGLPQTQDLCNTFFFSDGSDK